MTKTSSFHCQGDTTVLPLLGALTMIPIEQGRVCVYTRIYRKLANFNISNTEKNIFLSWVRGYHRTNTIGGSDNDNNGTR